MLDKKTNDAIDLLIKKLKDKDLSSIKISNKTNSIEITNTLIHENSNIQHVKKNLTKINQIIDPQLIILAGFLTNSTHYSSGIKDTLQSLGTDGNSALSKLKLGNVNIIEATCFMPLLKTIFTPNFNFEELYHSSHLVEENITNKKVIA